MKLVRRWGLPGLLWIVALGVGRLVAHDTMASQTIARLQEDAVEVRVNMASTTAWTATQNAVAPGVEFILEEFETVGRGHLIAYARTLLEVAVDDRPVPPREVDVVMVDDHFEFRLVYPVPARGGLMRIEESYLTQMPAGYISNFTVLERDGHLLAFGLLDRADPAVEITLPDEGEGAVTVAAPAVTFGRFLKLGVEHILTGYDHLLFLAGLLVVCWRLSAMLVIITCFTLAHSLTLALAALDVVTLPPRAVEAVIAASIVYVGVENLVRRGEPKGRWVLTLVFGLIHGFGFAGVLKEIGLGADGSSVVMPLFAFNLGVELGQIAVALVVLPIIWRLQKSPAYRRRILPALSGLVALAGAYWLVERVLQG